MNAVSGMETALYMLLLCLCGLACVRLLESPAPAAVWQFVLFGLLATLTRPEFGLPFVLMASFAWWRLPAMRMTLLKAVVVLYVLPGLALTFWRYSYYGDVVPNAFHVKQSRGLNRYGLQYVVQFVAICALPYLMIVAGGWRRVWRRQRNLLFVTAINLGAAALYFSTTLPLMGWWQRFLLPQLPLLALLAAAGLAGPRTLLHRAAGVLMVLMLLLHLPLLLRFVPFHHAHETRYREVGQRLRPLAAAERWLTYYDVGSLVYESEWNTIDTVGLNTLRRNIKRPCEMRTDLLLRMTRNGGEIRNPCPDVYQAAADLPFMYQPPGLDIRMRVFARQDAAYIPELRKRLLEGWPEPFSKPADWLAVYWRRLGRLVE
jgi:hypothetical protein